MFQNTLTGSKRKVSSYDDTKTVLSPDGIPKQRKRKSKKRKANEFQTSATIETLRSKLRKIIEKEQEIITRLEEKRAIISMLEKQQNINATIGLPSQHFGEDTEDTEGSSSSGSGGRVTNDLNAILDGLHPEQLVGEAEKEIKSDEIELLSLKKQHSKICREIIKEYQDMSKEELANKTKSTTDLGHSQTVGVNELILPVFIRGIDCSNSSMELQKHPLVFNYLNKFTNDLVTEGISLVLSGLSNSMELNQLYSESELRQVSEFIKNYIRCIETNGFCVYSSTKSPNTGLPIPIVCDGSMWTLAMGINQDNGSREYRLLKNQVIGNVLSPIMTANAMNEPDKIWKEAFLSVIHSPHHDGSSSAPIYTIRPYVKDYDSILSVTARCVESQVRRHCYLEENPRSNPNPLSKEVLDTMGVPSRYAESNLLLSENSITLNTPSQFDIDESQRARMANNRIRDLQEAQYTEMQLKAQRMQGIGSEERRSIASAQPILSGMTLKVLQPTPIDPNAAKILDILSSTIAGAIGASRSDTHGYKQYSKDAELERLRSEEAIISRQKDLHQHLSQVFTNIWEGMFVDNVKQDFDNVVSEDYSTQFERTDLSTLDLDTIVFYLTNLKQKFLSSVVRVKFTFLKFPRLSFETLVFLYNTKQIDYDNFHNLCLSAVHLRSFASADPINKQFPPERLEYPGQNKKLPSTARSTQPIDDTTNDDNDDNDINEGISGTRA